ncbi:MAG: tetratricopeptide repeat protein [Actinobacteria bacterium]|nr:MAG: tetratricopeptide repeat protein [Actinomycetota bacterium]
MPSLRQHSKLIALLLFAAVVVNGLVLAWRYAAYRNRPASTYYEYQVQRWQQQLVIRPSDPAVWATLGGLYEEMGEKGRAQAAYARALELDPKNAAALVHDARLAAEQGRYDEGRRCLKKALSGLPKKGRYLVYFTLGELEESAGRPVAAARAYEASVADNDTFWNAHYRLAFIYYDRGDSKRALAEATRAERFMHDRPDLERLLDRLRAEKVGDGDIEEQHGD